MFCGVTSGAALLAIVRWSMLAIVVVVYGVVLVVGGSAFLFRTLAAPPSTAMLWSCCTSDVICSVRLSFCWLSLVVTILVNTGDAHLLCAYHSLGDA